MFLGRSVERRLSGWFSAAVLARDFRDFCTIPSVELIWRNKRITCRGRSDCEDCRRCGLRRSRGWWRLTVAFKTLWNIELGDKNQHRSWKELFDLLLRRCRFQRTVHSKFNVHLNVDVCCLVIWRGLCELFRLNGLTRSGLLYHPPARPCLLSLPITGCQLIASLLFELSQLNCL